MEAETGVMWGCEPRNADDLQKLGKARTQVPRPPPHPESSEGAGPADTLFLAQQNPFQTSDLQNSGVKQNVLF